MKLKYFDGIKDGLPVCFAYLVVSFTFGIAASGLGINTFWATLISATNLTSAGQFAGIKMIALETGLIEIFIAVFIINSRYMLMSLSLSQSLTEKLGTFKRLCMSFFVTDEIFAIANFRKDRLSFKYFMGLATTPYFGWSIGTLLGSLTNSILPPSLESAMGIALYCMFIAIIIPPAIKSKAITFCIAISVILSVLLYYVPILNKISFGVSIIISALISAGLTAYIFPIRERDDEEGKEAQNAV
ncbi:MAG: AzlC family ABC transporter permease [Clostridiales bacterium]|nr:AzlC family ABC transporter permease [Clostridiales bacterium]